MPTQRTLCRQEAEKLRKRWDLQQELYILDREGRFAALIDVLESAVPSRARILDLGCGTGSLSERVLDRLPQARVIAIDRDPLLLRIGRTALGTRRGRLTWVDADLRSEDWPSALPRGRFDAAVSSTALHWLSTAELGRFYRILSRRLKPGAIFLNADSMRSGLKIPRLQRVLRRAARARVAAQGARRGESWREFWDAVLEDPRLSEEAALRRARFPRDHRRTRTADLRGHERLLRRSGFREVAVVWSRGRSRILAAIR